MSRIKTILDQLKERGVRKTLTIYASSALSAVGIVKLFSEAYGLSPVIFPMVLTFLTCGLASAFVFAWFHGKEGSQKFQMKELLIHTILLAIALVVSFRIEGAPQPSLLAANATTIAVLPFANLSGNPEDEYFSDGVTEDILTQISRIRGLNVISRTSVMQYKGTKKSIREIGNELNAGVILEGSIRRSSDKVRIVAQLVDANNDKHLWANTYDKEFKEIFAIQSEVAQRIAGALEAKLSPAEKEKIDKKPTTDTEAYNLYLKGRDYYYRYKKQDNEIAVVLFKKAIELDPGYALAWAGLGDAFAMRYGRFGMAITWLDSSVEVGKRAIALDGDAAEAHKALGLAYVFKGQYDKSLEAYLRAVELNPNYFPAVGNIGTLYYSEGKFDEAIPWLKRAGLLAPTNAYHERVGDAYRQLGDVVKAEYWLKKALELKPDLPEANDFMAHWLLVQHEDQRANDQMKKVVASNPEDPRVFDNAGVVACYTGNLTRAKEYFERSIKVNPGFNTDPKATSGIGLGYVAMKEGKQNEARKWMDQAQLLQQKQIDLGDSGFPPRYYLAAIHAIEGDEAGANAWLEKAIAAGYRNYYLAQRDPWLENLRNDQKFLQTMAQLKTKLDEMRKKVEEMDREEKQ